MSDPINNQVATELSENGQTPATQIPSFADIYHSSINDREQFWAEQAKRIYWHKEPEQILDDSNLPFAKWFVGGETNLCYNCVDRHLPDRAEQDAFIWLSSEINQELIETFPTVADAFSDLGNNVEFYTDYTKRRLTYNDLYKEVNYFADVLQRHGVGEGDRVIIYMPMILEAAYAMLACARIGAIHSVVFGGFAAHNLAIRMDDAEAKMVITVDAGLRGGKVINYKNLVNQGVEQATAKPEHVLVVDRGILPFAAQAIDIDYATERRISCEANAIVEPVWLESNTPSYLLYTSGTTGTPKGVQRDTGGHAVALTTSMDYIYDGKAGETFWAISDIGWAVGHSYTIYAPLLAGMTSVMYEGLPHRPNPGIWWRIVEANKVNILFTAPTGVRMLKKQDETWMTRYDVSSLKSFFLAGEPLDQSTAERTLIQVSQARGPLPPRLSRRADEMLAFAAASAHRALGEEEAAQLARPLDVLEALHLLGQGRGYATVRMGYTTVPPRRASRRARRAPVGRGHTTVREGVHHCEGGGTPLCRGDRRRGEPVARLAQLRLQARPPLAQVGRLRPPVGRKRRALMLSPLLSGDSCAV